MKTFTATWIALLMFCASPASSADAQADEIFPPGLIRFDGASAFAVLDIYKELSGAELLVASNVNTVAATITLKTTVPLTRVQALRAIEQALLEQAGMVINKLDEKRVSVTYNDALPLKLAPGTKPPAAGRSFPVLTAPDGKTYFLAPDGRQLVPTSQSPIPPPVPPPFISPPK